MEIREISRNPVAANRPTDSRKEIAEGKFLLQNLNTNFPTLSAEHNGVLFYRVLRNKKSESKSKEDKTQNHENHRTKGKSVMFLLARENRKNKVSSVEGVKLAGNYNIKRVERRMTKGFKS